MDEHQLHKAVDAVGNSDVQHVGHSFHVEVVTDDLQSKQDSCKKVVHRGDV